MNTMILAAVLAALPCWPAIILAQSADSRPEIRLTPEAVGPGEPVEVSVEHSTEPGQRFCFQSDDIVNLPLNTMRDSANPAELISVSKGWRNYPNPSAYGGSFINSETAGASIVIPFTGEFFRIYGIKAPKRGIAGIYLDGKLLESVDTYSPQGQIPALLHEKYGLKNGPHEVEIVVTGEKRELSASAEVSFDVFESGTGVSSLKVIPKKDGRFAISAKGLQGDQAAARTLLVGAKQPGTGASPQGAEATGR